MDSPEHGQPGYDEARVFTRFSARSGHQSSLTKTMSKPYDTIVGKVICGDKVLNAELLYAGHAVLRKKYCARSEFSDEYWARDHGC